MDSEAIYQALFDLVSQADGFVTASRHLKDEDSLASVDKPALYQTQLGATVENQGRGDLSRDTMHVALIIYGSPIQVDNPSPSTELNQLIDGIRNVIKNINVDYTGVQTLGGLVDRVVVEGNIEIDEGILTPHPMAIIPIKIIAV